MDGKTIREIGMKSCREMKEQISILQDASSLNSETAPSRVLNEIDIDRSHIDEFLIIHLRRRIYSLEGIGLYIEGDEGGKSYGPSDVTFDQYDDESMTMNAYLSDWLKKEVICHDDSQIQLLYDMKWLIDITYDTFDKHGESFGYPKFEPPHYKLHEDYEFPKGFEPNDDQIKAVDSILNNRLTYIWGAPGTGKTQYVLATAVIAYLKKGKRVAIMAPTNNAVEQALRGVLATVKIDDPNHEYICPEQHIIRLGMATKEFMKQYKGICEDKEVMNHIRILESANSKLYRVLLKRDNILDGDIDSIEKYHMNNPSMVVYFKDLKNAPVSSNADRVRSAITKVREFKKYASIIDYVEIDEAITTIKQMISEIVLSPSDIRDNEEKDKNILLSEISSNDSEIQKMMDKETGVRMRNAKLIALTPFTLMGRENLFEEGGIVDVDHIFVDEAGYANLIQTMPVFMCGPPVTMLGDHMQLPPVCELKKENIETWMQRTDYDCFMRFCFMWDQSARYIESFIFGTEEDVINDYLQKKDPVYRMTVKCDLTKSHRFAENLAKILDKCVYKNGISGRTDGKLNVFYVDVKPCDSGSRMNINEVKAITKFIDKFAIAIGKFAILTPYTAQRRKLIEMNKKYENSIMTIHGSQGREWDTVIISVADNELTNRPVKLRFTSSIEPCVGLKVMNTAVSRAKKNLIIFCDYQYWKKLGEQTKDDDDKELIGMILLDPSTTGLFDDKNLH